MYEYLVPVPKKVRIHERSGGLGHGEGGRMVVPDLTREGDPEPVNYWATINSRSGVYNSSTQADPRLDGLKVPLKEHAGVGGWGGRWSSVIRRSKLLRLKM